MEGGERSTFCSSFSHSKDIPMNVPSTSPGELHTFLTGLPGPSLTLGSHSPYRSHIHGLYAPVWSWHPTETFHWIPITPRGESWQLCTINRLFLSWPHHASLAPAPICSAMLLASLHTHICVTHWLMCNSSAKTDSSLYLW